MNINKRNAERRFGEYLHEPGVQLHLMLLYAEVCFGLVVAVMVASVFQDEQTGLGPRIFVGSFGTLWVGMFIVGVLRLWQGWKEYKNE
ncbi:MAG: hypothetical protein LUD72_00915 [Bacteroidales bacterium]|nr:hypothetical protein [Bacteroidales bacterium]